MTPQSSVLRATLLLSAVLVLAGCSSGEAPAPTNPIGAPLVTEAAAPPPPGATGAPVAGITTLPPVPVGQDSPFGGGLVAKVVRIDPVQIAAQGPGEIAGPGASVTVQLDNGGQAPVDLAGVVVNAYDRAGTPTSGSDSKPAAVLTGALGPGESKQGVYVFQSGAGDPAALTVEINYSGSPHVVLVRR
jgi:hypothetical protein